MKADIYEQSRYHSRRRAAASLDAARGRQVVEMIRMEVKKHDKGAVMVTHDERVYRLDTANLHYNDL